MTPPHLYFQDAPAAPEGQNPVIVERRREPHSAVIVMIQGIQKSVEALDTKITEHKDETVTAIKEIVDSAFPGGDPHGHRRAHEAAIAAAEWRREFWRTMAKELGKWGLVGFVGWAGYQLWIGFLQGPHK